MDTPFARREKKRATNDEMVLYTAQSCRVRAMSDAREILHE